MRFGVEDDLMKRQNVIRSEKQVEILERLGLFIDLV